MKNNINKQSILNIATLISKMTLEDKRNVSMMRNSQIFMWLMAPIYLIIFNVGTVDEVTIYQRLEGVCFALAFISFALIMRKYHKVYKSVNYGIPTIEMLKKATERYQFQIKKIPLLIIPIVLIDLGITIGSLSNAEGAFNNRAGYFQLIYWGLMIAAMSVGYLIWRKKQKPLRDAALTMLKEMEE